MLIGVLPFFHSFGFTVTLWFPLAAGFGVAYHPNPMDAKTIGELAEKHAGTILIATPTFCSSYIAQVRAGPVRQAAVRRSSAPRSCASRWRRLREKFGVELLEGYGCTEMSPVVAVNAPDVERRTASTRSASRPGTVGHPLPGVAAKVVDPETGEGPIFDREGLLLVNGPNCMRATWTSRSGRRR